MNTSVMLKRRRKLQVGSTVVTMFAIVASLLALSASLTATQTTQATDTVYDAFVDFSSVSNPAPGSTWQYGYISSLGGDLNLYTVMDHEFSLSIWESQMGRNPNVIKNETEKEIIVSGEVVFPTSDFLHSHPGPTGSFSVIRWIAPATGGYLIASAFKSIRSGGLPTTTDVHVLHNSNPIFNAVINGHLSDGSQDFSTMLNLYAGDTIDFVVGPGINLDYTADSTGVKASIRPISIQQIFLPLIHRPLPPPRRIHGLVNDNGAPAPGVPLELRFYDGATWSTRANTTTATDGTYEFLNQPALTPGQKYYVRYLNTEGAGARPDRLWLWWTQELTTYSGEEINIGNFDLANITLVAPTNEAGISLPYTFQWAPRPASPTDSYEFNLFDYADDDPYFYTAPPLGYVGGFTLNGLPEGFETYAWYLWNVWVYSPDGGVGVSYWANWVYFTNTGYAPAQPPPQRLVLKPAPLPEDWPADIRHHPEHLP